LEINQRVARKQNFKNPVEVESGATVLIFLLSIIVSILHGSGEKLERSTAPI